MTSSRSNCFYIKGAPVIYRGKHWIFTPLNLYDSIFLLSFSSFWQKLLTQGTEWEKRWETLGLGKAEKIEKHNLIPICHPIRSLHHCCPSLICQLPNQSKHSRCIQTRTNGLSLGICLFIRRVRWNMKTAALNWFSVREQTVKGKCCGCLPFPCYSWMHPDMEIFQCSQGLNGVFVRPGKCWIIMLILIRASSDNTLKCLTCWKL